MKKLKVLSMAAVAAGMVLLTSCLNGGSNQRSNTTYALVDYSNSSKKTLIYPLGFYPLYMSNVASDMALSSGDCIFVNYSVDFDSADNANADKNGFYVGTGTYSSPLPEGYIEMEAMDSTSLNNEQLMTTAAGVLMMSDNHKKLLAIGQFGTMLTEQKNEYILTFDANQKVETVNSYDRVYTLYLRCRKLQDGKAPTLSNVQGGASFEARSFYEQTKRLEKNANKEVVSFQIKYPKEFNSDSTLIKTWGVSDIAQFSIKESTSES